MPLPHAEGRSLGTWSLPSQPSTASTALLHTCDLQITKKRDQGHSQVYHHQAELPALQDHPGKEEGSSAPNPDRSFGVGGWRKPRSYMKFSAHS